MAFSDPFQALVISSIQDKQVIRTNRLPQETESGFDSMRETYVIRDDAAGRDPIQAVAERLKRGTKLTDLNMWIVNRTPRCIVPGFFSVEVVSMGLLSERGYKVRYDTASSSQTGKNIFSEGEFRNTVAAREAQPTVDLEYVLVDAADSINPGFLTVQVGTKKSPPSQWVPAVKDSVWLTLTEYTWHYPNEWVFTGVQMENLPGRRDVYLVRERYEYQYKKSI